jgi:hypothetical protein
MAAITKEYYALEEIEACWGMSRRDLVYLAENGLLKVSIRLYGVRIENGCFENVGNGDAYRLPEEETWFQGLLDLRPGDVYRLFHEGQIRINQFDAPTDRYCHLLHPEDGLAVKGDELVVRREERDRAESRHGLGGTPRATKTGFEQKNDFAEVTLDGRVYHLGPIQSRVVGILYQAAADGAPWRHGKQILADAGSSSPRLVDLFKTQPDWRALIQSNKRGKYCLNIKFF